MIPDDGRKWGRDKITVTLTRRQWCMILRELLPYKHQWGGVFLDGYFNDTGLHRAKMSIENQIPNVKEQPNGKTTKKS